jgi:hypothetical protein
MAEELRLELGHSIDRNHANLAIRGFSLNEQIVKKTYEAGETYVSR